MKKNNKDTVTFIIDDVTSATEVLKQFEFKVTGYDVKHFGYRSNKGVSYCKFDDNLKAIERVSFHEWGADIYYSKIEELPGLLKDAVVVKAGTHDKKKELLKSFVAKEVKQELNHDQQR